jgi:hypothetical protein
MKKINSLLLILAISMLAFCKNASNNKDMNVVEKVVIKSIDFSLMTIISVKCDEYEQYFKKHKVIIIEDSLGIQNILQQLSNLEPIDSTYSKLVDTRSKIELITSSDTNTICVGNLSLHKDGNLYKTPQRLIDYIDKLE